MLRSLFPRRGAPASIAAAATRAQVTTTSDFGWTLVRGADLNNPANTGNEVRLLGWERHPVVNACIRAVVAELAAVPWEVYRIDGSGQPVVLARHEALDLLNMPQPALSPYRLRARTGTAFLTYGNGFWYLDRGKARRGLPKRIRLVAPERVTYAWINGADEIVKYDWRDASGTLMPETPAEDMVHFRDLDARDGFFGYPRGAAALLDIDADGKASQYVRQVLGNDGTPTLLLVPAAGVSPEDAKRAEEVWRERQVNRGERGNTRIVGGLEAVHQLGFKLSELEFPELRGVTRESICAAFGVDPRMIGLQSAASDGGLSGQQYREARLRLIQQTVLPVMAAIESELNTWLMPEYGDVYVRFSPSKIAEMTEDKVATSTRVLAELAGGARTLEETREVIGLDAEPDPSHHLALTTVKLTEVRVALEEAKKAPAEAAQELTAATTPAEPDEPEEEAA
jgi:HK97 family phage portal protein